MSDNILWKGPRLLIPMKVEALVMTQASVLQTWSLHANQFSNINSFNDVFPDLSTASNDQEKPGLGVTLHWSLPDGFNHGTEDENSGDIIYPRVPNRWLVLRNGSKPTAWIIFSDKILTEGGNQYPDFSATSYFVYIGDMEALSSWQGGSVGDTVALKAIGYQNPSFTAYTANLNNVFSFYDELSDLQNTADKLSYSVYGWYANPSNDLLNNWSTEPDWENLMDDKKWSIGEGTNYQTDLTIAQAAAKAWFEAKQIPLMDGLQGEYPAQTLCHGFVFDVNWLGYQGKLQSGVPDYDGVPNKEMSELPQIALGNTSIDAFSELIERELYWNNTPMTGVAQFLQKFQYNLLNDQLPPSQDFTFIKDVHDAWFGSQNRGKYWSIVDPNSPDPPELSSDLQTELDNLNTMQASYQQNQRSLLKGQRYLYTLWWKEGWANGPHPFDPPPNKEEIVARINDSLSTTNPQSDYSQIAKLQQEVQSAPSAIQTQIDKVKGLLTGDLELLEQTDEKFWRANAPVVMIYKGGRSYKYGADGRFSPDGLLFTRFTGQTITGIKVTTQSGKSIIIDQSNIDIPYPDSFQNNAYLPKDVLDMCVDLWIENYFLDTNNASAIAEKALSLLNEPADPSLADTVKTQQTLIWNKEVHGIDDQTIAAASGLQNPPDPTKIPSLIGVNPWTPPWSPLYLSWEITWYPSYTDPAKALENWSFDPKTLQYIWNDSASIDKNNGVTLKWNTVLTPQSSEVLEQKLGQYLDQHQEEYQDLINFLDDVAHWDFLSQAMTGIDDMWIGYNHLQLNQITDNDSLKNLVQDQDRLSPLLNLEKTNPFLPIRAGHFQINQIWIVDDFGQVFSASNANGTQPENYVPVLGEGLVYDKDPSIIQMPPRIVQGTKLLFRLVSSKNKEDETYQNPGANPVSGWILPNHLDKGLTVYAADGTLLGEILLVGGTSDRRLRWDPRPGTGQVAVGTPLADQIQDKHLLDFVEGLINNENSAQAFSDFIQVIDETLWTIDPLGGRGKSNLSVLVGRPLALVRAKLQYQLSGDLLYDQSWENTALKVTGGYEELELPVQLGTLLDTEDGLLGFFPADDYSQFHSVHQSELVNPESDYIINKPVQLGLDQKAAWVTMILDPRGRVNAISGVLPIQELLLPDRFVDGPLQAMQVTFRTGPLITAADNIRMPMPAEIHGKWSWIQHTGITVWEETTQLEAANYQAQLNQETNVLKEGWLKLSDALGAEEEV